MSLPVLADVQPSVSTNEMTCQPYLIPASSLRRDEIPPEKPRMKNNRMAGNYDNKELTPEESRYMTISASEARGLTGRNDLASSSSRDSHARDHVATDMEGKVGTTRK